MRRGALVLGLLFLLLVGAREVPASAARPATARPRPATASAARPATARPRPATATARPRPATATARPAPAHPAPAPPPVTATATGNLVILLDQQGVGLAADRSAVRATVAQVGARPAGRSVPDIGLLTVRPPRGVPVATLQRSLEALPGVASAQPEFRYVPRTVPDDPALRAPGETARVAWQWYLQREGFYRAWGMEQGKQARVGVIDTGVDATHPDLASKLAATVDQQSPADSTGPAGTDQVGHGTHVASLACAGTGNRIGLAGAGYGCRLVVEKTDFTDSSIAAAIVDATKRHVQALNMSFGPPSGSARAAPRSEVRALRYAAAHRVVLVAAASDSPGTEQGDPGNVLQPAGTGGKLSAGIGLDVTAADYSGRRATFAGSGSEISLAAYGAFAPNGSVLAPCNGRPFGLFGAFPGNSAEMESFPPTACRVNFRGDNRYATIAGTSMAAPQVAATAALMRVLNPYATLRDILTTLKRTAARPRGRGWTSDLGWGVLRAGAALDAIRRVDHLAPVATLAAPRLSRGPIVLLRWSGHDQQRRGLIASGIAYYELFARAGNGRAVLVARTRATQWRVRARSRQRYVFWVVAVDRAGNRERQRQRAVTRVL